MNYRPRNCLRCGGKKMKYQEGGFPKQSDYPDYESWQQAVDEFTASNAPQQQPLPRINIPQQSNVSQADFLPEEAISASTTPPDYDVIEPRRIDDIDRQANDLYASGSRQYQQRYDRDLGMSVLDNGTASERRSYRNFYRGKYGEGINPVDPFRIALGAQTATTGLAWLSGVIDRRRQNRYLRNNLSTLGRFESQPASNFQPNPYNLYAKLGGNIKKYMFTNKAINPAFPVDNGRMQQGGLTPPKGSSLVKDPTIGTQNYYDYLPYNPMITYPGDTLTNSQLPEAARRKLVSATGSKNYIVAKTQNTDGSPMSIFDTRYIYKLGDKDIRKVDSIINNMSWMEKFRKTNSNIANSELPSPDMTQEEQQQIYNRFSTYPVSRKPMKKGGNWIPKNLKKGRCTPAPNPDCPVGSPQYNLAMTFKKHHGFHK